MLGRGLVGLWSGRRRAGLLVLGAVVALAGCSGRTTGATNIGGKTTQSAQLNAIGSCDQTCTVFMRYRQVGTSTWTNLSSFNVGEVSNVPWYQIASGLSDGSQYEYQACGKEASASDFVCVGPDGSPSTTQKFVAVTGSTDWPEFHHDPALTGSNPYEVTLSAGNVGSLTEGWAFHEPATHSVVSSPAVANGVVYLGITDFGYQPPVLDAFPAFCATGGGSCSPLWSGQLAMTGGVGFTTPAVNGNGVYVGSSDGKLYAFSAGCGASTCGPLWTGDVGGSVSSPTVTASGSYNTQAVFVGSSNGNLYAFSGSCGASTCTPVWTASTFGAINTAPALASGVVYVGTADHHLYAFNASDGTLLWTAVTGAAIHSSPAVANGVVYVGSDDHNLYAFKASDGTPLWAGGTGDVVESSPAVANGVVYVGSSDGKLYAFPASGCGGPICAPLWTGATGGPLTSSPAVANGVVYVESDKLYEFAASGCGGATCSPLASQTPGIGGNTSPAVAGGVVYVGALGGNPPAPDGSSLHAYSLP